MRIFLEEMAKSVHIRGEGGVGGGVDGGVRRRTCDVCLPSGDKNNVGTKLGQISFDSAAVRVEGCLDCHRPILKRL